MTDPGLDLLVVGDCNPDLILSAPGLTPAFDQVETLVDNAELTIGGSGAIMACAAARLGLRTGIVAIVGDDLFGREMLDRLAERGVDTSGVIVDPAVSTGVTVILARGGDRAILTFPGAIATLTADSVDRERLRRVRHVHVSSYYLQTGLRPGLPDLFAAARRFGATTSVDPNWDPAETWDSGLPALLGHIDVLLPNAAEAQLIAGSGGDPSRAAQTLAAAGPLVVVKLGADGALAVRPDGEVLRSPAPGAFAPVDTVGAGDSFDAGLLAGLIASEPLSDALELACACGALSTRAAGGTAAQPRLQEARALRRA